MKVSIIKMQFLVKFDWNYTATLSYNPYIYKYVLQGVSTLSDSQLANWLTDLNMLKNDVFTLGIDGSDALLVAKVPLEDEYETGLQMNTLRDQNICPGVMYTYRLLQNTSDPISRFPKGAIWGYSGKVNLLFTEYIPGPTLQILPQLEPQEYYAVLLEIAVTLWIVQAKLTKVHADLHQDNIILRKLPQKEWIRYNTPIGVRWIYSSYIATVIDYGDLLEGESKGEEVAELFERLEISLSGQTYAEIVQALLDKYNLWVDLPPDSGLTIPGEKWRGITNVKQACVIQSEITFLILEHFNQSIAQLNNSINEIQKLLEKNSELKTYLTAMVTWADNLRQAYTLIDFLKCANSSVDVTALLAALNESKALYHRYLPGAFEMINKYLVPFEDSWRRYETYGIRYLQPYYTVLRSV